jgi:UDP-glucose-4-epimerase GalE
MRVLVTGGAGYIGAHTARDLAGRGHAVTIVDDLSTGHEEAAGGLPIVRLDLAADPIAPVLAEGRFEAVVHFAAKCLVPESVTHPSRYWRANALGSMRLLDAMVETGVRRIVFSSTCATYGIPDEVPIAETHPQRPITSYGRSKLAVEHMVGDYARAYGLAGMALRYFNAAGASEDGAFGEDHDPETHLIPLVLGAALGGAPLRIAGTDWPTPDGTCIRDYVHLDDLARAHALAIEAAEPGRLEALNIGTGAGHSVREVVALAGRIAGRPVPTVEAPRRPGDPALLVARNDAARARLGFVPERTIEDIVRTAWRWHSTHPRGYGGRRA